MSNIEGVIKFNYDWSCVAVPPMPELNTIINLRSRLLQKGWLGVNPQGVGFGNCSIAIGPTQERTGFLVTASQTANLPDNVGDHAFCWVENWNLDHNWVRCRGQREPSSETLTHASLYNCDPAIGCVIHIHHQEAWNRLRGVLPTTRENLAYGTVELAWEMERLLAEEGLGHVGCLVMGGHADGIIAYGADALEAMARLRQWVDLPTE